MKTPKGIPVSTSSEPKTLPPTGNSHQSRLPNQAQTGFGKRAFAGTIWLLADTFSSKILTIGLQLVLARLLVPEDFGLMGLAATVTGFALIVQSAGIGEVLVQRHLKVNRWSNAAFWMSLATSLLAALIIACAAPIAARIYGEPRLVSVMLLLALSCPLNGLTTVPLAILTGRMQFKVLAMVNLVMLTAGGVLTLLFAYFGFGVYALVIPSLIVLPLKVLWVWRQSRPRVLMALQFRRWRLLVSDSVYVFLIRLFQAMVLQGDYILLGLLFSSHEVGLYFFAFGISGQVIGMVVANFNKAVFPAMVAFHSEPPRQFAVFRGLLSVTCAVVLPASFILSALAPHFVGIFFGSRWEGCGPIIAALSPGIGLTCCAAVGATLLRAQGRFRSELWVSIGMVLPYFSLLLIGAKLGGVIGLAVGESVYFGFVQQIYLLVAVRGMSRMKVWHCIWPGLSAACVAWAVAMIVSRMLLPQQHEAIQFLAAGSLAVACATLTLRITDRATFQEVSNKILPIVRRFPFFAKA